MMLLYCQLSGFKEPTLAIEEPPMFWANLQSMGTLEARNEQNFHPRQVLSLKPNAHLCHL